MAMLRTVALAALVLAFGTATVAGAAENAHRNRPHIAAKPASVMVNTATVLTGSGFAPHRKLTIEECSLRTWVVPQRVCNHRNTVKVRTNAKGRFTVKLKALVCPKSKRARPDGFRRTCWVGVPHIQGIDTEALRPAAKLVVTGP